LSIPVGASPRSYGRFQPLDFRLSFFSDILEYRLRESSAVPGVFGPILTTGVALATAAVVVANPVNAPRADVQIPAVALSSGSGDAIDMLDENFLRAIAPEQESTSPFAVLKDLVTSLLASAAYLGRTAVVTPLGGDSATKPELTAASFPYFGAPAGPAVTGVIGDVVPIVAPPAAGVGVDLDPTAPPSPAPAPLTPPDTHLLNAVQDWAEADLRWAVDNANAAVATASDVLRNPQSLIDPSFGQSLSQRVSELPDLLVSLPDSLTAVVSLPHTVVSLPRSGLPSTSTAPARTPAIADADLSGAGIGASGDAAANKFAPAQRAPRPGAGDGHPDGAVRSPSAPDAANG
jgi:hypothetical protein